MEQYECKQNKEKKREKVKEMNEEGNRGRVVAVAEREAVRW